MSATAENFVTNLSWNDVAQRLEAGAAAILPVGAGAKQHGLHLPMGSDEVQANLLAQRLATKLDALIWPAVTYGFYPAFVGYAGSVSLSDETFETLILEIVDNLIGYGAVRVLVLNTGISTLVPVDSAIARSRMPSRVRHLKVYEGREYLKTAAELRQGPMGSHADELETSLMLALAPESVNMARTKTQPVTKHGPAAPSPDHAKVHDFSASGSTGDPALATREKGRALLAAILDDLVTGAA